MHTTVRQLWLPRGYEETLGHRKHVRKAHAPRRPDRASTALRARCVARRRNRSKHRCHNRNHALHNERRKIIHGPETANAWRGGAEHVRIRRLILDCMMCESGGAFITLFNITWPKNKTVT